MKDDRRYTCCYRIWLILELSLTLNPCLPFSPSIPASSTSPSVSSLNISLRIHMHSNPSSWRPHPETLSWFTVLLPQTGHEPGRVLNTEGGSEDRLIEPYTCMTASATRQHDAPKTRWEQPLFNRYKASTSADPACQTEADRAMLWRKTQRGASPDQLSTLLQKLLSFKTTPEKKVEERRKQTMMVDKFPQSDCVLNPTAPEMIYKCEQAMVRSDRMY